MFALVELHRSPVLLPRVSTTGFLLIPISFHPKTTRGKQVIGQFTFEHFQNHGLGTSACPADRGLGYSQVDWWAYTFSDLQANLSHWKGAYLYTLVIPKHLTDLLLFLQHRRCYFIKNQSQKPNRTNISGEESHHFSLWNVTQQSNNHGLPWRTVR